MANQPPLRKGIKSSVVLLFVVVIALSWPRLWAADLTKIERGIVKEPAYQKGAPRYCLAVFGREAQTRVWLILDGDTLYVDRNADLDLTAANERVRGKPQPDGQRSFPSVAIDPKPGVPADTRREVWAGPDLTFVYCRTPNQPWQRAVVDSQGYLKFSDKPQTAPVLHFYGPLTMGLRFDNQFKRRSKPEELDVMVGTPGLGAGSFVRFGHEGIPEGLYPSVEILWPGKPGEPMRALLKKRC